IERTAWPPGAGSTKTVNRCRDPLHGVWPAKVGPAVTTGTPHLNAISTATQCLICDSLKTGSIHCNEFAFASVPWWSGEQMPDSAEVPLPLFTNISDSDNRA